MNKVLFYVFSALLLFNSFAQSKELTAAQKRYKTIWEVFEKIEDKESDEYYQQADRVIQEAITVFSEHTINVELDPNNKRIILITVPANKKEFLRSSRLNKMAFGLHKSMRIKIKGQPVGKPLRVQFDPILLDKSNAGAMFDEDTARLTLASGNILTGEIDDMVVHELRHAYNFYAFAKGIDHAFYAWVHHDKSLPIIHETYEHVYSADEMAAHLKQVVFELKKGEKEPDYYESVRQFTESGLKLSKATNHPQILGGLALTSIQNLIKNPQNWSTAHESEVIEKEEGEEETKINVWMFNSKTNSSRIYFYETPLLESQKEVPITITHAVVENGLYKINMNTRERLNKNNMVPLLKLVSCKLNDLAQRNSIIETNFTSVLKSLKKEQYKKALQQAEASLPAIALENPRCN